MEPLIALDSGGEIGNMIWGHHLNLFLLWHKMTKILSDKYPLLLILHLARLSSSCDLVTCVHTHRIPPPLWKEPKLDLKDF